MSVATAQRLRILAAIALGTRCVTRSLRCSPVFCRFLRQDATNIKRGAQAISAHTLQLWLLRCFKCRT
jgi:hypothetical protein